ncbi:MAG: elongation factor P maturation arginine rhamnosyltransferase EarP [Limnobacter sp.]|nr:elongation factor P maturation arginine rhamnosyltransferase EarP [Limnobacter sp.]
MHFLILCRVIDNLGDAGFCTRLALQLHKLGHRVEVVCDKPSVIQRLANIENLQGLTLVDMGHFERSIFERSISDEQNSVGGPRLVVRPNFILEPFGTSSEQTSTATLNDKIKNIYPELPWLVIDYLSAQEWTKSFHLTQSTCPRTGHVSSYFYPGFGEGTGGVIHSDLRDLQNASKTEARSNGEFEKLFVFSYPAVPLQELDACLTEGQSLTTAGDEATPLSAKSQRADFCSLPDFDDLLQNFDFLFVRGEDSFVRAQLAGKPFVWNIYATEDGAEKEKLLAFFSLYRAGLSDEAAGALLSLWWLWNELGEMNDNVMADLPMHHNNLADAWKAVQQVAPELQLHAKHWKQKLLNGPELVGEILTWAARQSLTNIK